ncbi:insulinase family protein [Pontibaca methylaminivorans]|uniref:Peptidase M16C associated domain-containing protein n=1 Tax=Pontibaca methylaminivorans TaxID=515897 RepID=A0A1R3WJL0_9RHOB|nr:insulinase family protein [Pontibaca methylaminivorans]SIT77464.1 hypothetical protein SAMN05421849_0745 [Pontibaca methylaminivorans]
MTRTAHPGFAGIERRDLPEIGARALHLRHIRTGADVIFLQDGDSTRSIAIALRTRPEDSSGVAHVLEHCVLSGSRAYPGAQPFADLLKTSLHSHLNAATFPDFTIYTAASFHPGDFRNLSDVYLDAVFFPLLREDDFDREGWHGGPGGAKGGIVLNEMRGFHASPDAQIEEFARRSLFRAGPGRHSEGGEADAIPALTVAGMRAFHRRFYHPSNALVAFAGAVDMAAELARLDRLFSDFAPAAAAPAGTGETIPAPRFLTLDHPGARHAQLALNRAFAPPETRFHELGLELLCEAVIGHPGAPLRRALADAGVCRSIREARYRDDTFPPRLAIRLDGIAPDRAEAASEMVEAALAGLARKGIAPQVAAAALDALELRLRDPATRKRPEPLARLLGAAKAWRAGRPPLAALGFAPEIASLRSRTAPILMDLLEREIVANPRRSVILMRPAPAAMARDLPPPTPAPRPQMGHDAPATPGSVPRLRRAALGQPAPHPRMHAERVHGVPVLLCPRRTNGLVHIDLAFDAGGAGLSLASLLGPVLVHGPAGRRIAGLSVARQSVPGAAGGARGLLLLRARALPGQAAAVIRAVRRMLAPPESPPPPDRFARIIAAEIARIRAALLPRAHEFLDLRLRDPAGDHMSGIEYLRFLHVLDALNGADPQAAAAAIGMARDTLITRTRLGIAVTWDGTDSDALLATVAELAAVLPGGQDNRAPARPAPALPCAREGFSITGSASHIGMGLAPAAPPAALFVALRALETGWLRRKLRDRGGAYGVVCRGDREGGRCALLSYRDPNLLGTLDTMAGAGDALARGIGGQAVENAVISALGLLDRPLAVGEQGPAALADRLAGRDEAQRGRFRAEVLGLAAQEIRAAGDALSAAAANARIAILANAATLESALSERPGLFEVGRLPGSAG